MSLKPECRITLFDRRNARSTPDPSPDPARHLVAAGARMARASWWIHRATTKPVVIHEANRTLIIDADTGNALDVPPGLRFEILWLLREQTADLKSAARTSWQNVQRDGAA